MVSVAGLQELSMCVEPNGHPQQREQVLCVASVEDASAPLQLLRVVALWQSGERHCFTNDNRVVRDTAFTNDNRVVMDTAFTNGNRVVMDTALQTITEW